MMLQALKQQTNLTQTENGALTYRSTLSDCLDFFACVGGLRTAEEAEIRTRFSRALAENADLAMKTLFYSRDVRGGLGERRIFRVILSWLAVYEPERLKKNIPLIPEYGRFDDLLTLLHTPCEAEALEVIRSQLRKDLDPSQTVSLLGKWLPSVNASARETVAQANYLARKLGMTPAQYRKTLVQLREKIGLLENDLRRKDYSFDYSQQPSRAMLKYRKAFIRNDGARYHQFLNQVRQGKAVLHTQALMPYDVIAPCVEPWRDMEQPFSEAERLAMDTAWNQLEEFTVPENALAVIDGSGSMYTMASPSPAAVALSLGIYFAEHNQGAFANHFITFSKNPQLVEIKGRDIVEKVRCCAAYNEVANTDLQKVFDLILEAAVRHHLPQKQLPEKLYIISDMEFDCCVSQADCSNFEAARARYAARGYHLPDVIFWNVASRNRQQPVTHNQQGAALVSGCTPRLFSMAASGTVNPTAVMLDILNASRYEPIHG